MRNLALLTGSALAFTFAFASGAEDKAPSAPATPAPAPAASSPAAPAPASAPVPAATVAPGPPIDLSTPEPAAAPAPATASSSIDDLEKQLSDNQEKLTTSLRSYELLNEENQRLKSDSEKLAADKSELEAQIEELKKSNAFYQAQGAIAGQVDSLRTQLRQTQNEVAALASENAEFRTRIALEGPMPASSMSAPTRPAAAQGPAVLAPVPVAMAPLAAAAPAAAPAPDKPAGPRYHVVVAGDSLTKLSKQYYGTANRYGEILGANRKLIHNEDILPLGAKLLIP